MANQLIHCRHCGKLFRPCSTKINGAVTFRRFWCSPACYQASLAATDANDPANAPNPVATDIEEKPVKFVKKTLKQEADEV